jgi:Co/Zn/Cd efflux system component
VTVWAWALLRVPLDAEMDAPVVAENREAVAKAPGEAAITELHVWRAARGKHACMLSVTTGGKPMPDELRRPPHTAEGVRRVA